MTHTALGRDQGSYKSSGMKKGHTKALASCLLKTCSGTEKRTVATSVESKVIFHVLVPRDNHLR